jgi:glycolate oxidase iron-sulfur subunit
MQTVLAEELQQSRQAQQAQGILRACVHCGFCASACPTYQLTGNELDGPRGRIYLIKQMLEGAPVSAQTQSHLDRCLTCGACEPACPSGVQYRSLLEIGREMVEARVPRSTDKRLLRWLLRNVVGNRRGFAVAAKLGRAVRWLLPDRLQKRLPAALPSLPDWPQGRHSRRMLVLPGCVQPTAAPLTNLDAALVLDRLGITLMEAHDTGCCGALSLHLADGEQARLQARRNIDVLWPHIEAGAEAIVMTASGCGLTMKEYDKLLNDDPAYAAKAARISALTRDLAEIVAAENLESFADIGQGRRVAFQCPCTMQHGSGLGGIVEGILRRCGYAMTHVPNGGQCCGSAGAYSLLQPELSQRLLDQKLEAVMSGQPEVIVSANVGCQMHLATKAERPVKHWIELLEV